MSEKEFNEIFSKNLRYRLERSEMTQKELAKLLGVGPTSVYNWLNAIKTPRMDKVDAMCNIFHCKRADLLTADSSASASDPLQSYLSKLSEFLTGSPEHRQLVSDAAHVRTEDIELACQFLERLADPDSAAPDLPVLDTCNRQKDTHSDTLDTDSDTLGTFNRSKDTFRDTLDTSGDTSRHSDHGHVELTADTLALVRDTPEVLEAEEEYIKKMSVKPPKQGGTVSPSTEGTNRKSG